MLAIIASATGVFAGTDLDDLVVLTALFGSRRLEPRTIVGGQYLGMAVLVAVSALAALGLVAVPDRWVGLFGVVPLALGVHGLVRADTGTPVVTTLGGVAAITIANGADNISVYTPLFRKAGSGTAVYVAVFIVLVAAWLAAGAFLASRRQVVALLERGGRWLVPLVYIAIGTVLIAGSVLH
jgi:cadmium resistance protein CadD (predicted permease)